MQRRVLALPVGLVALLLAAAASSAGQEEFPPQIAPPLRAAEVQMAASFGQLVETNQLRFAVVAGRITIIHLGIANLTDTAVRDDRREHYSILAQPEGFHVDYEVSSGDERLSIAIRAGQSVELRYLPADDAGGAQVEFSQAAGSPTVLSVRSGSRQQRFEAASLWHLLIAHPAPSREYLLPHLAVLRPDWQLGELARAVERELLRMAKAAGPPDRGRWAELVDDLGDDRFAVRQTADRELRRTGRQVASFLEDLDPAQLGAEQHFRVRRILFDLDRQEFEDVPAEVASALLGDAAVWRALLEREDPAVHHMAAEYLAALTGEAMDRGSEAD